VWNEAATNGADRRRKRDTGSVKTFEKLSFEPRGAGGYVSDEKVDGVTFKKNADVSSSASVRVDIELKPMQIRTFLLTRRG